MSVLETIYERFEKCLRCLQTSQDVETAAGHITDALHFSQWLTFDWDKSLCLRCGEQIYHDDNTETNDQAIVTHISSHYQLKCHVDLCKRRFLTFGSLMQHQAAHGYNDPKAQCLAYLKAHQVNMNPDSPFILDLKFNQSLRDMLVSIHNLSNLVAICSKISRFKSCTSLLTTWQNMLYEEVLHRIDDQQGDLDLDLSLCNNSVGSIQDVTVAMETLRIAYVPHMSELRNIVNRLLLTTFNFSKHQCKVCHAELRGDLSGDQKSRVVQHLKGHSPIFYCLEGCQNKFRYVSQLLNHYKEDGSTWLLRICTVFLDEMSRYLGTDFSLIPRYFPRTIPMYDHAFEEIIESVFYLRFLIFNLPDQPGFRGSLAFLAKLQHDICEALLHGVQDKIPELEIRMLQPLRTVRLNTTRMDWNTDPLVISVSFTKQNYLKLFETTRDILMRIDNVTKTGIRIDPGIQFTSEMAIKQEGEWKPGHFCVLIRTELFMTSKREQYMSICLRSKRAGSATGQDPSMHRTLTRLRGLTIHDLQYSLKLRHPDDYYVHQISVHNEEVCGCEMDEEKQQVNQPTMVGCSSTT